MNISWVYLSRSSFIHCVLLLYWIVTHATYTVQKTSSDTEHWDKEREQKGGREGVARFLQFDKTINQHKQHRNIYTCAFICNERFFSTVIIRQCFVSRYIFIQTFYNYAHTTLIFFNQLIVIFVAFYRSIPTYRRIFILKSLETKLNPTKCSLNGKGIFILMITSKCFQIPIYFRIMIFLFPVRLRQTFVSKLFFILFGIEE